ncbi:hypothetical protein [Kiloniella laminariae]|uniref:hypothetical protein n=1 Tax=Kiloniella laminariae TaxID=454162 RepID=UPI0003A5DD2F|nr:hypothetical protein [Kiloniella laminariae]
MSFGIFIFLFIFLTITLLGPLYLQNKPVMDAFINHSKQQLGSFIESSRNIRAFLWLALCIWVLTWGIVTLRLLFAAYPPDMIETIRHIYGDPSAEHFKNSAQNLFYHFLIIGSILTFTPVFLVFCYRLRAKGTD